MRITTAAQSAARDAEAIASGIDSWALMHAAGTAAAEFISVLAARVEAQTIVVWAGTGNNGGDAYVVAAHLLNHTTFVVTLKETGEPRTPDAKRARALYLDAKATAPPAPDVSASNDESHFIFVDGLLGTGQRGALRAPERELTEVFNQHRRARWTLVALDVPTGVNATSGEIVEHAVRADYTLAFGTMKRAHVLQRDQCGEIVVFDIGLGRFANGNDDAWTLADEALLTPRVPKISWDAHKGTRGRVAVIGGSEGMAGAVVLSAEAALRSGAGLVFVYVAEESVLPVQINVPQAMAHALSNVTLTEKLQGVHSIVVGPGFGRGQESAELLDALVEILIRDLPSIPIVLDADALTLIANDTARLKSLAKARAVVCTPHVGEFARLIGKPVAEQLEDRIMQGQELVAQSGCTLLLKGTPTVVLAPEGNSTIVVARGTPVLATGGSGDMLSGMIGTLLAQGANGADAAAVAAWVHGRAAELAVQAEHSIRGLTLREVLTVMPGAWQELAHQTGQDSPVAPAELTRLPRVWSDLPL